ncbi:MAG: arsenic resistance N-acetyltransferase ArsN2 [bacterium]
MNTFMNNYRDSTCVIRNAVEKDYASIQVLLKTVNLPVAGVKEHLQNFIILVEDTRLIGTVGLEIFGRKALLRSLAIAWEFQRRGHGRKLCQAIIDKAREQKLTELFLLTEAAESFFASIGFETIARETVDEKVKTSIEFRSVCPESATCMRLRLV